MSTSREYPTHVYWDERDGGFVAIAPDLPGCSAFAESREEALNLLDEAIVGWISSAEAAGEVVPEPSSLPKPSNYSGKVLLRLPVSLHERLAKEAEREGVSLNQWMVTILASKGDVRSRLMEALGQATNAVPTGEWLLHLGQTIGDHVQSSTSTLGNLWHVTPRAGSGWARCGRAGGSGVAADELPNPPGYVMVKRERDIFNG